MTDAPDTADFRSRLKALRAALDDGDSRGREGTRTVALDQQSVGRLSRMDALQQQQMARAQERRRASERARIDAALARIASGEYGYCTECGEEIALRRLLLDPAVPRCLDCMRG